METDQINPVSFNLLVEDVKYIKNILNAEKKDYPLKVRWLNVEESCKALNVSKRTFFSYKAKGWLPFSQIGGKIMIKASDIEDFLEKHYLNSSKLKK